MQRLTHDGNGITPLYYKKDACKSSQDKTQEIESSIWRSETASSIPLLRSNEEEKKAEV